MHEVGQVIFLVSRKSQSVISAQICEQIVKKTLSGEETTFRIMLSDLGEGEDSSKVYDLSRIDAEIYKTPEEAKQNLYDSAKSAIDALVDRAVDEAIKSFQYDYKSSIFPSSQVKKPEEVTKSSPSSRKQTKKISKALKESEASQAPEDADETINGEDFVVLADGTKARLRTSIENLELG